MLALAPAPRRTARTWSVVTLAIVAIGDAILVLSSAMFGLFELSAPVVTAANAGAALLIICMRFVSQQIELTRQEKIDLITATANAPMLPVNRDILVKIDGKPVV